ncbi:MAG: hypothetical protein OXU63_07115 [Acidobacteriota bacterium]|nr:hypothetical protein [Acidobacteriota bacterium]
MCSLPSEAPEGFGLVAQPILQRRGGNVGNGERKVVVDYLVAAARFGPRRFSTDLLLNFMPSTGCSQCLEFDLTCDAESLQEQNHGPSVFDDRVVLDECRAALEQISATTAMVGERVREQGFTGSPGAILRHDQWHEILATLASVECPLKEFDQRKSVLVVGRFACAFNESGQVHILLSIPEPRGAWVVWRQSHTVSQLRRQALFWLGKEASERLFNGRAAGLVGGWRLFVEEAAVLSCYPGTLLGRDGWHIVPLPVLDAVPQREQSIRPPILGQFGQRVPPTGQRVRPSDVPLLYVPGATEPTQKVDATTSEHSLLH